MASSTPQATLPDALCLVSFAAIAFVCLFVLFSGLLLVLGFSPPQVLLHLYIDFDPLFLKSSNTRTSVAPESEAEF